MNLTETITAKLKDLGMYTAPESLGALLADRMAQKVNAIKFYRAEGHYDLAERELTETTFGPKIIAIVTQLANA